MTSERRTDQRSLLHSPVEITGIDDSGRAFAERSRVQNVGDSGCCFSIRSTVRPGSLVGIEPLGQDGARLPNEHPRPFVIIWVSRKGNCSTVGARSIGRDELAGARFASGESSTSKTSAK